MESVPVTIIDLETSIRNFLNCFTENDTKHYYHYITQLLPTGDHGLAKWCMLWLQRPKDAKHRHALQKCAHAIHSSFVIVTNIIYSAGQTGLQVDACWTLGSTCDSVWPCLACTCVDLRGLALILVEIKFSCKSTQAFHRLAIQLKSTQVEWHPFDVIAT